MKRVVVGSTNPVKIRAAQEGFGLMFRGERFEVQGIEAASGVRDQPQNDMETLNGARNRARHAADLQPQADFYVGIEGGIDELGDELVTFAWVVVLSGGSEGKAKSGTFVLPREVSELVRQGIELGDADDMVFKRHDSKRQNGSIGILTGDVIDRAAFYSPAVVMALIPFKNPSLTFG
jgi:inosine/xanthosine triphosphatase